MIVVMIIIVLIILGLIFGSFVNALVWRIHEQSTLKGGNNKLDRKQLADLSILKGRSMCPNCHHELAAKDLVPVLSWLALGGKCRYCRKPISWQYPLVELLTAGLFVWSYLAWPLGHSGVGLFQLIVWLVFIVMFVSLAVYDLRWMILPDRIVLPLAVIAVAEAVVVAVLHHNIVGLWQPIVGAAIVFGLFWVLFQVSRGSWIGGGDVKLAFALGFIVGTPLGALLLLFFSSVLGTLSSLPLIFRGKGGMKAHISYGPYLLAAAVIVQLYGAHIISWYQRLLIV